MRSDSAAAVDHEGQGKSYDNQKEYDPDNPQYGRIISIRVPFDQL
jgi:hypothetical protein